MVSETSLMWLTPPVYGSFEMYTSPARTSPRNFPMTVLTAGSSMPTKLGMPAPALASSPSASVMATPKSRTS